MMALRLILALVCVASTYASHFHPRPHPPPPPPPDRCARHSVTMVSCANVNSPDSLVAHPDDCNLFYYCVQPNLPPVCRECPANLHFNPVLHVCDWPYRAGCKICSWPSTEYPIISTTTEHPKNSTSTDHPTNTTTPDYSTNATTPDYSTISTSENPTSSTASENPTDSTPTDYPEVDATDSSGTTTDASY